MAMQNLRGMKVAILVANDFEQVEMVEPRKALEDAGAQTMIVSPSRAQYFGQFMVVQPAKGQVQAIKHDRPGDKFDVDIPLEQANPNDFDALLLPGGALNPDQLRINDKAKDFVRAFDQSAKPIACICHAPWTLVSAGLVLGRTLTSWPTIQDDIKNAGGIWVNQDVAQDGNWISSRGPQDIPAFNRAMIQLFSQSMRIMRKAA